MKWEAVIEHLSEMLDCAGDVLGNPSVSAFLGALFAFLFMLLLHKRRARQARQNLLTEFRLLKTLLPKKRRSIQSCIEIAQEGRVGTGMIMPFQVADLQRLKYECLHLLGPNEKIAVDALLFRMSGTDDILGRADKLEERIMSREEEMKAGQAPGGAEAQTESLRRLQALYEGALKNLDFLDRLLDLFLKEEYARVIEATACISDS